MKKTLFIPLLILFVQLCSAQNYRIMDTLEVFPNKIWVEYKTFEDSIQTENIQAYLYTDTLVFEKRKWLFWTKEVEVIQDSIVYHGNVRICKPSGKYKIGYYNAGIKKQMTYYDEEGNLSNQGYFRGGTRSHRDPELGYNLFFIHGKK